MRLIRFLIIGVCVVFYVLTLAPGLLLFPRRVRLFYFTRGTKLWTRLGLWVLRVKVKTNAVENLKNNPGSLVVQNHLSYLDILVLSSRVPMVFISTVETRRIPVLGLMAKMGGSVFVERRNTSTLRRDLEMVGGLLNAGMNVCLFPEGTSSDGAGVLPFKTAMYSAARKSGAKIVPACLRYTVVRDRPATAEDVEEVAWYGDKTFPPHLWKLCGLGPLEAEMTFLEPLDTKKHKRKKLGELSHRMISECYCVPAPAEKEPARGQVMA